MLHLVIWEDVAFGGINCCWMFHSKVVLLIFVLVFSCCIMLLNKMRKVSAQTYLASISKDEWKNSRLYHDIVR